MGHRRTHSEVPAVPLRVLIVDDHDNLRDLFSICLSMEDDLELAGTASDGFEAVDVAGRTQPDVIVLDWGLPLLDGLHALPALQRAAPQAQVIVFSATSDDATAALALSRGAVRFLVKDRHSVADVIAAVRECGQSHQLSA
jgi:DNA-binding NarL/FixJ family response regulator